MKKSEYISTGKIVKRAIVLGVKSDPLSLNMDLELTNTVCPLDFEQLLEFDDENFLHDIYGILRYFDRDTKKLTNCFLPRCAKPEEK